MDFKNVIQYITEGKDLTEAEAFQTAVAVMDGATEAQIAGLLVALRMKGETVDEITGFARAMRGRCSAIVCSSDHLVDTCGTGGDGSGTFNISTAAALVAAGAGCRVAKHGNRSVSSRCGSADVLDRLGVRVDLPPDRVRRSLEEVGIGFLFAPVFHPAMARCAGPRREIGVRTIFNILGPLTNPAAVRRQVLGVFSERLLEPLCRVLRNLGAEHCLVVHGQDGMDEISLAAKTDVCELKAGELRRYEIDPAEFGFAAAGPGTLHGCDPQSNADIIRAILDRDRGPRRDITLLNAGAAVYAAGQAGSLAEGIRLAAVAIDTGRAREKLEALRKYSRDNS